MLLYSSTILNLLIFNNICETKAKTGNSIKGPMTNAKAMSGSFGNAVTAIANDIGEFLANIVKFQTG